MYREENGDIETLRAHLKMIDKSLTEFREKSEAKWEKLQEKLSWLLLMILILGFFAGMNSTVSIIRFIMGK